MFKRYNHRHFNAFVMLSLFAVATFVVHQIIGFTNKYQTTTNTKHINVASMITHLSMANNQTNHGFAVVRDNCRHSLPQAIVIGSRKCGTRALIKFLQINPFVAAAKREVHFFDQNYDKGLEWYRQQMPQTNQNQLTVEKSPAYFVTAQAPERIKSMNTSVKLILVLRNPVTRLISDYSQLAAKKIDQHLASLDNNVNEQDLNDMWQKESEVFESYILRHDGGVDDQRKAVWRGMYALHLERWRQVFPTSQIHIVDGEALINSPHRELAKLETFLNIEHHIRADDFVFVKQKGFYCLNGKNKQLQEQPSTVEPICLSKQKGRRHVNVSNKLRTKLQKFYAPYNQYLYSLTGVSYDWN